MTERNPQPRASHLLGATLIASLAIGLTGQPALAGRPGADLPAAPGPATVTGTLAAAFDTAATRYDVPRDLLVALGYAETHLDGHAGAPSASGGYGVMHLTSNPKLHTLDEAAALTGLGRDTLRGDSAANVTGAAAVLRSYADAAGLTTAQRRDVNRWYGQVVRYGGASTPPSPGSTPTPSTTCSAPASTPAPPKGRYGYPPARSPRTGEPCATWPRSAAPTGWAS
ncbi:hypothetical protein [Plantactinospora veratri]